MNFRDWLYAEMPITRFDMRGDWGPNAKRQYGFNRQDVGILSNPAAVAKIHKSWSNSKQNFDFYFIRQKHAYKYIEEGEVDSEWLKSKLGLDIQPNPEAITIIFTNNTGAEKIPMTAWTIAHRLGHAVRRDGQFEQYFAKEIERDFRELLREIYNYQNSKQYGSYGGYGYGEPRDLRKEYEHLKALAQAVGTMRSARQRNLRNFFEFIYELLAQYIITGKIKFNPLPQFLLVKNTKAWGHPAPQGKYSRLDQEAMEEWNETLQGYAEKYEHYLDSVLSGLTGRIFVM